MPHILTIYQLLNVSQPHIFIIYQLLNASAAQAVTGCQSVAADDAAPSGSGKTGAPKSVIIVPPSDQSRDIASSAVRKGMLMSRYTSAAVFCRNEYNC